MSKRPFLAAMMITAMLAAMLAAPGRAEAGWHHKRYGWSHYSVYKPVGFHYYGVKRVHHNGCNVWSYKRGHCLRWY